MRTSSTLSAVGFALALAAGCGGSSSTKDDLSISPDMTASTGDAAMAPTCYKIIYCAHGCSTSACETACTAGASQVTLQKYQALFGCGYGACVLADGGVAVDGGAGSCASDTDTSTGCTACLTAASEGTTCAAELTACENDTGS